MLSKIEYERVIITAYELRKFLEQEDNSKNNLHWLFIELLRECGSFWPFLSLYLKTLQKEVSLIKPCDAYEAGLKVIEMTVLLAKRCSLILLTSKTIQRSRYSEMLFNLVMNI